MSTQDSWLKRNKLMVAPWIFLIPALIFFFIYVVIPIFKSIGLSFYEWNGLYRADGTSTAEWVGFDNYVKLWSDPNFWTSLKNNVLWLVLYMLAVPAGLLIALFLNQTVTGMRFYKSMFFFPFVISQVVVGLIFGWFYNPDFGIVGSIWKAFYCEETVNILGNASFKCSQARAGHSLICRTGRPTDHLRRALAAGGLLHDPVSDRPEQRRPIRSRPRGWTARRGGGCCGMWSSRSLDQQPSSPSWSR